MRLSKPPKIVGDVEGVENVRVYVTELSADILQHLTGTPPVPNRFSSETALSVILSKSFETSVDLWLGYIPADWRLYLLGAFVESGPYDYEKHQVSAGTQSHALGKHVWMSFHKSHSILLNEGTE